IDVQRFPEKAQRRLKVLYALEVAKGLPTAEVEVIGLNICGRLAVGRSHLMATGTQPKRRYQAGEDLVLESQQVLPRASELPRPNLPIRRHVVEAHNNAKFVPGLLNAATDGVVNTQVPN